MRTKTAFSALLAVSASAWLSLPALAAVPNQYVIEITDSNAVSNREFIVDYPHVGSGDVLTERIEAVNKTENTYGVKLQKAAAHGNGGLLDSLTFTFAGTQETITLTAADFDKTDWSSFFSLNGQESGNFTLTTTVGELTNTEQGGSCSVRYTFEVVYLGGSGQGGEIPPTGGQSRRGETLALAAASLSSLMFAALYKRPKKKKERP
ncbi:MAG: hypothetical protein LBQ48_00060 [Oscillospiraceae bacterium]|jgi:hypothetical protein|nr:hypothetical protein [Oscillospiraceae bacterium]